MGFQPYACAWVTSALNEDEAEKALILAASLKAVYSSGKLVVLASPKLSDTAREKLYHSFDLVNLIEEGYSNDKDYVKVFAFSLCLFQSCVYLPPNSLALKKSDDIFSKVSSTDFFAAVSPNSTVFLFRPSANHFQCLKKVLKGSKANGKFTEYIKTYALNNGLEMHVLDKDFCHQIELSEGILMDRFVSEFAVIEFGVVDPKRFNTNSSQLGLLEKFAIDRWWNLFHEEINGKMNTSDGMDSKQYREDPIAIVGMSCRFPGANNLDEFWKLLIEGREGIQQVPQNRWKKGETITTLNSKVRKTNGGFLDFPIDEFDAKFFGISPAEAELLDPQQRLLHEITWEALEDAAIDPQSLHKSHTGVFVGSWIHDYKDIALKTTDPDFFRIYMGCSLAATAARLSHFFKITGPSIATECGCSSAIVAVDLACKSLRKGETNLAFASGVNLFLHPFEHGSMKFVLAPNGRCKTFSADSDGFGRSEGCGVLILKRMSDAIANGDKIWALIRGTAISQEGVSKSLGTPTVHGESLAMELALKDAHVNPNDVSFVEAHGTGTLVGDPLEIIAITKVYSGKRTTPLLIGSVKTNVGHTEAVSGITGIIKVVLSMKNEIIPPHLNFTKLNPDINLDAIPAQIPLSPVEWKRTKSPRIAGVSSFGISGTDGHAIIQESPQVQCRNQQSELDMKVSRPLHYMKISAKSAEALDSLLKRYETLIEEEIAKENGNLFQDIAYTANVGRATYNHRASITARDNVEALKILKGNRFKSKEIHGGMEVKLCFLFTGQGSQYNGMAQTLYQTSPVFKMAFDKCDNLLKNIWKIDIGSIMWESDKTKQTEGLLNRTIYSQLAIFVVEYALMRLWISWGITPDYVLGHSLGEFAGAVCAGILDLKSALKMVVNRSLLINALPEGKMLVLRADKGQVEELLSSFKKQQNNGHGKELDFAALNTSDQTVLAGDTKLIKAFSKFCTDAEVKNVILAATHAFHSSHMDPILEKYQTVVNEIFNEKKMKKPSTAKCQYISGMEGKLVKKLDDLYNIEYWVRHTREKVNFLEASKAVIDEGCNIFLEIGPRPVLSTFILTNSASHVNHDVLCMPSLRNNQNDWETILESLDRLYMSDFNNVKIDWKGFDQYFTRKKVNLPFYPFQKKRIWVEFKGVPGKVHPLLGQIIPNASKSTIFEVDFTLKQMGYLKDHAIGSTVIFPGAALLEMCVVAGHCAVQGLTDDFLRPRRPISLKGLRIEAPLAIQDGKASILQTVVDLSENQEENVGYSIKVYNWFRDRFDEPNMKCSGQWKSHVSAHFLPHVTDEDKSFAKIVDIVNIKENWEKVSIMKELYEKLPEVGLCFGPAFQSLVCGWRKEKSDDKLLKSEDEDGILLEVKCLEECQEDYLIHPIILDAMLQASMLGLSKEKIHKKLHVPVHIGEFTWLSDTTLADSTRYVYCTTVMKDVSNKINADDKTKNEQTNQMITLLLDSSGTVLASMCGIEFVETTVKLVESVIQQQTCSMPQLWEEVWKPKKGPLHARVSLIAPIKTGSNTSLSPEVIQECAELNQLDDVERNFYCHLDNLTVVYFLNALYDLGWTPKLNEKIKLKEFMSRFSIVDGAWHFMKHFFNELVTEGVMEIRNAQQDKFLIRKMPYPKETIKKLCISTVQDEESSRGDYKIITEVGKNLADLLLGKLSPLSILFPEDATKPNLGYFYDQIRPWVSKSGSVLNNALMNYSHLFHTKDKKDAPTFRVLEVGAGTGSATTDYLTFLEGHEMKYEYTYTDISAAFFMNAEVKFEKSKENIVFKRFNIEEDPLGQGFTPEYYDVITACEVIHAVKDIEQALKYIRMLLKTDGHIQITETTRPDRRITFLVGLLEGYWRFTDFDLRPHHATLTKEKWVNVLSSSGFKFPATVGCYNDVHGYIFAFASEEYSIEKGTKTVFNSTEKENNLYSWLVFCDGSKASTEIQRRLKFVNRKVVVIEKEQFYSIKKFNPEEGKKNIFAKLKQLEGKCFEGIIYLWSLSPKANDEQEQLSLPFVHLCQGVLELLKITCRLYVFTRGSFIGQEDFSCVHPEAATIWGIAKTLRNEQPDVTMNCVDLSADLPVDDQINEMFFELFWTHDGEELIAFRDGKRLVPRLASLKLKVEPLNIPNFCDRFQLLLPETKSISDLEFGFLNKYTLKDDEVEIEVKAAALNFRDIFAVLKPTSQFDKINSIGSDFSGVITQIGLKVKKFKVGDLVFGMNTEQQALPSHIKAKESFIFPIPDNYTFAEAATIPAVYATSLYCLISIAKIKKGDIILIHTASGGVGLSAVQIAQHFGAVIIATAGCRRKRAYLKSLGIQHVFHSRNTDYGQQILEITDGKGVDIVLNSLTGPGFKEASLNCCAKYARFIEMSKLNIWEKEEVQKLRKDVKYTVADLTSLGETEWKDLLNKIKRSIRENFIKPIPFTRYDALNIRQALGYLQKAKHIGKVVCIMPENSKLMKKLTTGRNSALSIDIFNAKSTYILSGGLGGIGFEVAKFMLESGAKYLILLGRSKPSPEIEHVIKSWNAEKNVEAWQVDVGDFHQVKGMLEKLKKNSSQWPPLRGVMHAAGVLQDATLPNQVWDNFLKTYNAKVQGTMNLHELTKGYQLEHFVLFSSVTSLFGSPGQANHTASNSFEDSFADFRHSHGLPATTINWANWGECGVAQDIDFPGIRPIATRQGLKALEAILKSNRLRSCVMNVDSFGLVAKLFPKVKGYVDDKRLWGDVKVPALIFNKDQFWNDVDKAEGREAKIEVFSKYIKNMLKNTLKMDSEENIDDNAEFQALGVDSLMMLEMKNYLQNLFGSRLTLTSAHLKDCNTPGSLATRLVDLLEAGRNQDAGEEATVQESSNNEKFENGSVPSA